MLPDKKKERGGKVQFNTGSFIWSWDICNGKKIGRAPSKEENSVSFLDYVTKNPVKQVNKYDYLVGKCVKSSKKSFPGYR